MKRVLVYVDAENISVLQFKEAREEIDAIPDCCVVGKFYGNSSVLGEIRQECYCSGYDFVETAGMSHSTKNVTDMKIAVDCISDVLHVFRGAVDIVYIISSDHDFLPLIYKLMGQGLEIKTPLLYDALKQKSCSDINKFLDGTGFADAVYNKVCECLVPLYMDATENSFPYDLMVSYVSKKKSRYLKYVVEVYGDAAGERVDSIPVEEFGFSRVLRALGLPGVDECASALDNYTRKVFGISITKADALGQISQMCSEGIG